MHEKAFTSSYLGALTEAVLLGIHYGSVWQTVYPMSCHTLYTYHAYMVPAL